MMYCISAISEKYKTFSKRNNQSTNKMESNDGNLN